jgi:hypothetical protein
MGANYNMGLTPNKVVSENIRFKIPIYQRLFVWDEEQIQKLFKDLYDAFKTMSSNPYHIGAITVVQVRDSENDCNVYEVVDGQQRLTFLTLFSLSSDIKNRSFAFIGEKGDKQLRIRYVARSDDELYIRKLANGEVHGPSVINRQMEEFVNINKKFCKGKEDIEGFCNYVYQNATFFISELPEGYSPVELNYHFEKMNSSGRQLEADEIIKVLYFGDYAQTWNQVLDFSERFAETENRSLDSSNLDVKIQKLSLADILASNDPLKFGIQLPDQIEPENENQKESNNIRGVVSIQMYLLHVLSITLSELQKQEKSISFDIQKIEKTFADKISEIADKPKFIKDFIRNMVCYRKWLDENIIHIENNSAFSPWRWKEGQNGKPGSWVSSPVLYNKVWQFQSMLYVSYYDTQRWILDAFIALGWQTSGLPESRQQKDDQLYRYLRAWDAAEHPVPGDIGELCYGVVNRYFFWKLDYLLWLDYFDKKAILEMDIFEKEAILNYSFKRNQSIEHLSPQTSKDGKNPKNIHSFGNLAMISPGFNSAQSNDRLGVKFARLTEDQVRRKELESIKLLLMFKLADGRADGWTDDKIQEHASAMHKLLQADQLVAKDDKQALMTP